MNNTAPPREITTEVLEKAARLMFTAKAMAELYEENKEITAKYVHHTSP